MSKLKSGDKVVMVNCSEADTYSNIVWTTRSDPWMVCGAEVILLVGKSGGFATECLRKATREEKEKAAN